MPRPLPTRRTDHRAGVAFALLLALCAGTARADGPAPPGRAIEFNRDIRPILSENCFSCHGPDKNTREADLRLDLRDDAIAQGVMVPGKPEESELVFRVVSDDPAEIMPPPESNKVLTPAQRDLLARWIAQGAEYEPHWAYVAPDRPEVPSVRDRAWVRNPVDAFILYELEARGIEPSPEADRRTLIRRVSLDLTGLPPTPEEVEAFAADDAPDAYERLVDRLLASPRYGERMAVPWLDLVRFSDTVGYHGDQNQNIFPYRDYVIDAFNRNKPFDRFTVEQIAGDLLPDASPETLVASGFNRLNMMTREGGAQPKEYLAKYAADRVRTVSITWLGSTMGCAECHDHKYDPYTTRDFYSMAAFFADVKQWGVYADYGYTPNPDLRGYTNDHPFPPEIEVDSPYLLRRRDRLRARTVEVVEASAGKLAGGEPRAALEAWVGEARATLDRAHDGWVVPTPAVVPDPDQEKARQEQASRDEARSDGKPEPAPAKPEEEVRILRDGSLLLTGKVNPGPRKRAAGELVVELRPGAGWVAAIRVEALPHVAHQGKLTRNGSAGTGIQLSASRQPAGGGSPAPLGFAAADADHKEIRWAGGLPVLGVLGGWRTDPARPTEPQTAVWVLDRPVRLAEGDALVLTLRSEAAGRVRLAVSPIAPEDPRRAAIDPELAEALRAEPGTRTPDQARLVAAAYLRGTGWDADALAQVRTLDREVAECRDGKARTMVTGTWEPVTTRVLRRGNWLDETGAVVEPAVPGFLPQPTRPDGRRLNRLDLARWLTAPENPLTARVFVNRLWKQLFGAGLSAVMEDVGAQGEPPSHPDLLDWLGAEFRESGWDVKRMVKLLVMSGTYRQDGRLRPELREVDPGNRLLASQSPRRLDAEFVRDNALAIAGLLNLDDVGGPSAKPYQPAGYYANIQFPDRDYVAHRDERQYRRGIYSHWQRTFLHPMLANFDAPSREECTASRIVANTPQQALTLLNDPTFVEAARVLAASALDGPARSDDDRIDALYRRALARPVRPDELASLRAFLATQREAYAARPDDARKLLAVGNAPAPAAAADDRAPELAAWTSLYRVVLNLHETLTRY